MSVILSKPLNVFGAEVTELDFNEPTGVDLNACGKMPIVFRQDEAVELLSEPMSKLIARTASANGKGLTARHVESLSAGDWLQCALAVLPFFGVSPEKLSGTATSSGAAGGAASITS